MSVVVQDGQACMAAKQGTFVNDTLTLIWSNQQRVFHVTACTEAAGGLHGQLASCRFARFSRTARFFRRTSHRLRLGMGV